MKKETKASSNTKATKTNTKAKATKTSKKISDDVYAAIAMALYEANYGAHDLESGVITFKNINRRFSPWALKTLTLRELPKR